MTVILAGGFVSFLQSLASAMPTLLIGLFIAALLRFYVGPEGTRATFGGDSWRSLPQSWLIGMLLPVCSIGVFPILREMKRAKVRAGAITAFALSAPLFNPLSLLYGLTLSRPYVICGFALASLGVVTILGIIWDRLNPTTDDRTVEETRPIMGLQRLVECLRYTVVELCGPSGALALIACAGVAVLAMLLPHGALQTSAEQDDILAPARMAIVAVPIYASPMLTMSQLGMMFDHGNSPGAAFCLLLLGTGINLATLIWIAKNFGVRPTCVWFSTLMVVVIGVAYAIDRPLIPPGVEPAGHTHAFDVYTNAFADTVSLSAIGAQLQKLIDLASLIACGCGAVLLIAGVILRLTGKTTPRIPDNDKVLLTKFDRVVPNQLVAATCFGGLVAFSIVACYAYYPSPEEVLEEIQLVRGNALSAANTKNTEEALRSIEMWDKWIRRLEVGTAIRRFELRPYQQAQAALLRKKLELLEHELEHDELEMDEIKALIMQISECSRRLSYAFRTSGELAQAR